MPKNLSKEAYKHPRGIVEKSFVPLTYFIVKKSEDDRIIEMKFRKEPSNQLKLWNKVIVGK